ncbi:hypothetical protein A7A76_20030 [Lysobacter enzymogenes]|uniref:zinc-finger-containing protein n=1 Tax=Lysobacter enzymogenes TaxID=69 RepID=UPI0019D2633B|nr:zinc-finger-containing protein [Lysobacter enzymogenes]MBN7137030.1 hypothetical protein [Lysobacter enzymogenes]
MRIVFCDYCGQPAELVSGAEIYPRRPDLAYKQIWHCAPCDAYVGCHEHSDAVPLGRLANAQLRAAKQAAHAAFDPLWREEGGMRRSEAYAWLAGALGIRKRDCHIAMFDVADCDRVVAACRTRRQTCVG